MNYLYCFFYWTGDHLVLHGLTHSFPTRRSSDRLIGTTAAVPAPSAGHPQGAPATADDRTDEPGGTSHMVIVDARGNAVSITTTKIGRAHVRTPVTNAHLVCSLLLEKHNIHSKKTIKDRATLPKSDDHTA